MTAPESDWDRRAAAHQARLTMPTGALGELLALGRQLCGIQQTLAPVTDPAAVVVMAADHGIAAEGVSAYPSEVTGQMVANFLRGGAAVNVLAGLAQARVVVVDMGVRDLSAVRPLLPHAGLIARFRLGPGTANFAHAPAMSPEVVERAIAAGRAVVRETLVPAGMRVVALGEMGIGNTTCAAALAAAVLGRSADELTGRGTGLDDAGLAHKRAVIERALTFHFGPARDAVAPRTALAAVGGYEIAGLVGVALEAAARRMVVVLDGFISSTAGLLAARIDPAVRRCMVAGHRGAEFGHAAVLAALELPSLLDLGLRLGEGSGAALALHLIRSSAAIMRDMATFETAGVSDHPAH